MSRTRRRWRAVGALATVVVAGLTGLTRGQTGGDPVRLVIREGTSMVAAASPDGRTLAIDLLGALWTLDVSGGAATRILDDGFDARQPAWSPDGRRLAFQAYRSSTWDIWTIDADGTDLQQLTSGPFDDREPHWSPDGAHLVFSSDRSGNYDLWILTVETRALRAVTSDPGNDFMPSWSPDGREIVFVSDRRDGRGVRAIAPDSGAERLLHAEAGPVSAPAVGPDHRTVAYAAVDGATTRLVVGSTNVADADEDVFPFRPQWLSPDEILYTANGQIRRRPASGGPARTVAFSAEVAFARSAFTPRGRPRPAAGPQRARGLMHPALSPDGRQVAFAAIGDLWLQAASGSGSPARLTHDVFVDTDPAWSPDGTRLAFASDRDGSMDLWVRDLRSGADRKLASRAMSAAWSPDGSQIAFLDPESQLQIVDVATGVVRQAHERLNEPGRPSWSPDGRALVMSALRPYSTRFREGTNQVLRVDVGAGDAASDRWFDPVPHKSVGMREDSGPVWSPDGRQMAAIVDGVLVTFPVDRDGAPMGPPRRHSEALANSPSWAGDSRRLLYQTAEGLSIVDVIDGTTSHIAPALSWTPAVAVDTVTVHAGRLIDGRAAAERRDVDVVIQGTRITRIEPHRPALHRGIVIDATNDTVLPGLIESHAHLSKAYGEALGRIWLAYGITSVRNPAANPFEGLEDREAVESGARIGPRVFTTGEPFDGTRIYYPGGAALDGGVQTSARIARAQALQFDFIKTYVRLPDVLQRRVIAEAHRIGLPVTSHEIYPAVAYGADGVEHIRGTSRRGYSPKMSELRRSYRDVVDLLAASKMTITPTIGIQGGYQLLTLEDGSWLEDERLERLFPASASQAARALRARQADAADRVQRQSLVSPQERLTAQVVAAGGRVIAGTDSPINPYGLSLLLELEHFVRGGMSPADAIRTATVVPADAMGYGADLGTLEPGKLADLVVVQGNPLSDIRDLRRTRLVVKDGVVYDREALLRGPPRAPGTQPARR